MLAQKKNNSFFIFIYSFFDTANVVKVRHFLSKICIKVFILMRIINYFSAETADFFILGHFIFLGTFLFITIKSDYNMTGWYNISAAKTSTLQARAFNYLAALYNHWSDESSFLFKASIKVVLIRFPVLSGLTFHSF